MCGGDMAERRKRVAVVGTGLAGLVIAHLLDTDKRRRFDVQVFEIQPHASLDSASVSVTDVHDGTEERIDVPMRAFTGGYYRHLKALYDHLGVDYQVQPFMFHFAQARGLVSGGEYFIHASNNHQVPPPRPRLRSMKQYLIELAYVIVAYLWFTVCCLLVPAGTAMGDHPCESLAEYLRRTRVPRRFVSYYLLPLMSAVTTCSHQALLEFPAHDVVEYRRLITTGKQYTVAGGVNEVQSKLTRGVSIGFCRRVSNVEACDGQVILTWESTTEESTSSTRETYDEVIFAVPPNVVGNVFAPLRKSLAKLPTMTVTTVVHRDRDTIAEFSNKRLSGEAESRPGSSNTQHRPTQNIYLRTSTQGDGTTEAIHDHASGAMVTSCPLTPIHPDKIICSSQFTRVLRTPWSRQITRSFFETTPTSMPADEKAPSTWRNGDGHVWLVGSWCWDGMVLLEGCVVSATRTARALGVEIPWERRIR